MKKEKVKRTFELGHFFVVGIKSSTISKSLSGQGDDSWAPAVPWPPTWNPAVAGGAGGGISAFIFLTLSGSHARGGPPPGPVNPLRAQQFGDTN